MNSKSIVTLCEICDAEVSGEGTVCQECHRAFAPGQGIEAACETSPLDLSKYGSPMFPWEQAATQPRLIRANSVWLLLALSSGDPGVLARSGPNAVALLLGALFLTKS